MENCSACINDLSFEGQCSAVLKAHFAPMLCNDRNVFPITPADSVFRFYVSIRRVSSPWALSELVCCACTLLRAYFFLNIIKKQWSLNISVGKPTQGDRNTKRLLLSTSMFDIVKRNISTEYMFFISTFTVSSWSYTTFLNSATHNNKTLTCYNSAGMLFCTGHQRWLWNKETWRVRTTRLTC